MLNKKIVLIFIIFFSATQLFADGLLISTEKDYPKDFMRNRITRVKVYIHGSIAETHVHQEFVNEWHKNTDAVYSFPLPPEARATEFIYWRDNIPYKAKLKVKEQATNPGTGEGGIIAEVNKYIGRNGIKVGLKNVPAGKIQRTELHYISMCDYYQGKCSYKFPLDTDDFVKHPLDQLEFTFYVHTNSDIIAYDLPTHPDFKATQNSAQHLVVQYIKPKAYIAKDLKFWFETENSQMGVDFYSCSNDSSDGHFALVVRPQDEVAVNQVFNKRIVFLLNNSSNMFGYKLSQSINAISNCLDLLSENDEFNIVEFNYTINKWKNSLVKAEQTNINNAKTYLSSIYTRSGSRMDLALKDALNQFPDDSTTNSIIVFTDGRSPLDPIEIEQQNKYKTGIFPIGIGNDLDRARLEMTAALNYGFVTYFEENDNLNEGMVQIFKQISQPILKNTVFEYGRVDLYALLPQKLPTTYAGSRFFMTGRYKNSGQSALAIAGNSVSGLTAFNFKLNFSESDSADYVKYVWAKEMIDHLERKVEIFGETQALKDSLIELSLGYNIRCRYTAYIADYNDVWDGDNDFTDVEEMTSEIAQLPTSYIIGNYPNPFNPQTTIRFYIATDLKNNMTKIIRIYNSIGQLIAVYDISHLSTGFHKIEFNAENYWGRTLTSGSYFVQLQVGNEISCMKILLLK